MAQVTLAEFIAQVRAGVALGSFPTDTVPALAAHPDSAAAIYAAKERPPTKPLILMAAHWRDFAPYLKGTEAEMAQWQQVADRYWPGALTLVLPASDRLSPAMNPQGTGTLGIRIPNHPLARYLLERTGPLATTSVNRSGQPALTDMGAIAAQFPQVLTLSPAAVGTISPPLPPPPPSSGTPSTVARWTGQGWEILRQGSVTLTPIEPAQSLPEQNADPTVESG